MCVGLVLKFDEGNILEEWGEAIEDGWRKEKEDEPGKIEGREGLGEIDCNRWEIGGGFDRLMKLDIELGAKLFVVFECSKI